MGPWSAMSAHQTAWQTLADVPVPRDAARELQVVFLDDLGDDFPSPAGTWEIRGASPSVQAGWILQGTSQSASVVLIGDAQERLPAEPAPEATLVAVPPVLQAAFGPMVHELTSAGKTDRKTTIAISFMETPGQIATTAVNPDQPNTRSSVSSTSHQFHLD